jgi:hypothetical protein
MDGVGCEEVRVKRGSNPDGRGHGKDTPLASSTLRPTAGLSFVFWVGLGIFWLLTAILCLSV